MIVDLFGSRYHELTMYLLFYEILASDALSEISFKELENR
jgi:hypothetical protein